MQRFMHKLDLPRLVMDRDLKRGGRLHIVDAIEPSRTALIIIDMQNAYLAEAQPGFVQNVVDIIPSVNAMAGALRRAGSHVAWIRNTIAESGDRAWPAYGELRTPESREDMALALAKDSKVHAISSRMALETGDVVIDKYRYSAFIRGSSD